jgi:hypothetical protein
LKGKRSENKVLAAVKLVIYQARREIATRFLPAVHEITALRCTNTIVSHSLAGAEPAPPCAPSLSVYYSDGVLSRFATFCAPTAAASTS